MTATTAPSPTPTFGKRITGAFRAILGASTPIASASTPRAGSSVTATAAPRPAAASHAADQTPATASRGSTHGNRSPATPPAIEPAAAQTAPLTKTGPYWDGVLNLEAAISGTRILEASELDAMRVAQAEIDDLHARLEALSDAAVRQRAKATPVDSEGRTPSMQIELAAIERRALKQEARNVAARTAPLVARAIGRAIDDLEEYLTAREENERSLAEAFALPHQPSPLALAIRAALERLKERRRLAERSPEYVGSPRQSLRGLGLEF